MLDYEKRKLFETLDQTSAKLNDINVSLDSIAKSLESLVDIMNSSKQEEPIHNINENCNDYVDYIDIGITDS